jgi:hypothetical protein
VTPKDKRARKLTPKEKKARELVSYRKRAHRCAKQFQNAMKLHNDACKLVDGPDEKYEAAMEKVHFAWSIAGQSLWLLCGGNPRKLPDRLRDIALALEGKLHGKNTKMDELLIKAFIHADDKIRKGHKGYDVALRPTQTQIDNALTILSGRNLKPTKRAAMRRLKQLGYG